MNAPASRRRWFVPLAGFAAVALFLVMVARFWHPVFGFTALIQLDAPNDDLKIAAFRERPVYVHRDTGGYDGLYYAQIAYHPLLDADELRPAIDNFAYRARRILPSALAWLLAGGNPAWIVHVYSMLNLAAWLALAALLWRRLAISDLRGGLAWAGVLFSAGALASVRLALTDLIALVILAWAVFAAEREKDKTAVGALAAAALARETALLGVAGLIERPWLSWKNFVRALAVVAPLALWLGYVRWRVGAADQGWANFTLPLAGFVEKWRASVGAVATVNDKILAWTTLLATLGLTAQAVFIVARPRLDDRWWRVGAAYVGLMALLGTAVWEDFPGAAMRVLLPLTLAFNILAQRTRAPLAWLLIGNLGVFAGFVAWRDVPYRSQELALVRSAEVAAIARPGEGWFSLERSGAHRWSWTAARGTVVFETWPKSTPVSVRLDFQLRSPAPRIVILRQDGREIYRTTVGAVLTAHHAEVQLSPGHATLEFATDTPGVPEGPNADARSLAFALYDLRLSVTEK